MRNWAIVNIIMLSITVCYASEYLVVVDNLSKNDATEYTVIRRINHHYFIAATESQYSKLQAKRTAFRLIDTGPSQYVYLLVGKCREDESVVAQYGTILGRYDYCFLLRTTQNYIDSLNTLRLELERLDFEGVGEDTSSLKERRAPEVGRQNDDIKEIVALVSIDTLRADIKKLQSFTTRNASSSVNKTDVCGWLKQVLAMYCDSVYYENFNSSYGPNVIGIRHGKKNPSLTNYCVLGAHLDGAVLNGPFGAAGADDNATGTAAVLECARVFHTYSFENTVRFILFNAEESGLVGSGGFVSAIKTANHTIIGGAVIFDMIGHSVSDKNTIQLEGTDADQGNEKFVTEYMKGIVDTYTNMITYPYLQGFGSDHVSFWPKGYIAMLLIEKEWDHPAYHQVFDTLDCPSGLNDMSLFTNITKTGVAAIADLAVPIANTKVLNSMSNQARAHSFVMRSSGQTLFCEVLSPDAHKSSLSIYTADGKLVRLLPGRLNSGMTKQIFVWDYTDANRRRVSQGVYVIVCDSGKGFRAQRVVVY